MPEVHQDEFFWVDSNEPHSQRRKAVLAKYGNQVRKLYGYDNRTAYQVRYVSCLHCCLVYHRGCCISFVRAYGWLKTHQGAFLQVNVHHVLQVMFVMAVQLAMAYHVRNLPWWKVLVVAYTVSGTCNQNLLSAQHEISHFLALKKPFWNKVLAVASNCPIVVPVATKFRQYHQEHHSHLVCPNIFLYALGSISWSSLVVAGPCATLTIVDSFRSSLLYNRGERTLFLGCLASAAVCYLQGYHSLSGTVYTAARFPYLSMHCTEAFGHSSVPVTVCYRVSKGGMWTYPRPLKRMPLSTRLQRSAGWLCTSWCMASGRLSSVLSQLAWLMSSTGALSWHLTGCCCTRWASNPCFTCCWGLFLGVACIPLQAI